MKGLVSDLIDKVYDDCDVLLLKNSGKEIRVKLRDKLRDIKNVNYQIMMSSPRVTSTLRHDTALGNQLGFIPPVRFMPFKKSKDIEELIDWERVKKPMILTLLTLLKSVRCNVICKDE